MKKVYGDDCMSRTQVYTWFTRFKMMIQDLDDQKHQIVREIIAIDANFTVRMLAEELNLCASGAETRFSITAESNGMLCIPLQRNRM